MMRRPLTREAVRTVRLGVAVLLVLTCACEMRSRRESSRTRDAGDEDAAAPYQADVEEGLGAAVAILVDTSGSMAQDAPGDTRPDLYRAGVLRKYLLVVTDGENTSGRSPDRVAREIFRKSEGAVQVYFVAFDTSLEKFAFLKDVGGDVIGAGTGAELRKALDGIYQGKILAEAPAAGEREPVRK